MYVHVCHVNVDCLHVFQWKVITTLTTLKELFNSSFMLILILIALNEWLVRSHLVRCLVSNTLSHLCQSEDASYSSRYCCSLLLEPRSLLVLQDSMYTHYLHGIAETTEDVLTEKKVVNRPHLSGEISGQGPLHRTTRVSLTIRHVPKTFKIKLRLK